jgi:hypothetical protein
MVRSVCARRERPSLGSICSAGLRRCPGRVKEAMSQLELPGELDACRSSALESYR